MPMAVTPVEVEETVALRAAIHTRHPECPSNSAHLRT